MARRLSLQAPVVFEPSAPPFLRRLGFLAVLAPGICFGLFAFEGFTGVMRIVVLLVIAFLSFLFCRFGLDGIEGKVIVDADGIEWRSPVKKIRLLWNDGLQFRVTQTTFARGGSFKTFYVISGDKKIAFGENLRNQEYLHQLVDAGINGIADKNSLVHVALPPPEAGNQKMVESFMLVSVLAFLGALLMGALTYFDAQKIYFTPAPRISEIAQYAGKDTLVRVKGRLHTEPPLVSRDGQHSYGFQFLQLERTNGDSLTITNPSEFELIDGADKLSVMAVHQRPSEFSPQLVMKLQGEWQKTEAGKMLPTNIDENFAEYAKKQPDTPLDVAVWNVEQDQLAEVVGHIKSEKGAMVLLPKEEPGEWLSPSFNKQIEPGFWFKAIVAAALLAVSIYLFSVGATEAKKLSATE